MTRPQPTDVAAAPSSGTAPRTSRDRVRDEVAIVDTGAGNLASLTFALDRIGAPAAITDDPDRVRRAARVIVPGVGAAGPAMARLRRSGLDEALRDRREPTLGICLGLHLLAEGSAEAEPGDGTSGLGLLPGTARALDPAPGTRIPHMGWSRLELVGSDPLLADVPEGAHVYFVHSFALPISDATVAVARHGRPFTAVARRDHVVATQFHPERSGAVGARILDRFARC